MKIADGIGTAWNAAGCIHAVTFRKGKRMKRFKCMGCQKRNPGCHDHCEDYIQARKEYDEAMKKLKEDDHTDGTIARLYKQRNRIHKRKKE